MVWTDSKKLDQVFPFLKAFIDLANEMEENIAVTDSFDLIWAATVHDYIL